MFAVVTLTRISSSATATRSNSLPHASSSLSPCLSMSRNLQLGFSSNSWMRDNPQSEAKLLHLFCVSDAVHPLVVRPCVCMAGRVFRQQSAAGSRSRQHPQKSSQERDKINAVITTSSTNPTAKVQHVLCVRRTKERFRTPSCLSTQNCLPLIYLKP